MTSCSTSAAGCPILLIAISCPHGMQTHCLPASSSSTNNSSDSNSSSIAPRVNKQMCIEKGICKCSFLPWYIAVVLYRTAICLTLVFLCNCELIKWNYSRNLYKPVSDSNFFLLGLVFSVPSQEIGWEERLRNDLVCFEWYVNPQFSSDSNYRFYRSSAVQK